MFWKFGKFFPKMSKKMYVNFEKYYRNFWALFWKFSKVGFWCSISQHRVIGPIFFVKSVDSDVYTGIIQNFIALLEEDERYAWFQQDGATAHTAKKTMDVLTKFF